ncbi:HNH endonuclease [Burkholderia pseudomallei]|uniref:HNH endonuclease n=1 Tax=Burkholderia pseudomallei TaxID=28450 RepID=UPI0005371E92|nr:HNH endonuclease [Burkholderia pseudomallei]KGX18258.1 putative hNH nuclease [Burkholderia pseudomallei ABCPW 1]
MGVMVGGRIVGRESSMLSHGAALQHVAGDAFLIQRYDESRNQCGYVGLVIMPDQNMKEEDEDFKNIRRNKQALISAIEKGRSDRWILRLWSRFIKVRDSYRCVCCNSKERIQSHHIVRKTLYPWGAFELGNGITLCYECHGRVHEQFNGRPDLLLPLGAEQGDDQDEWAFLFGLLLDDARFRGLDEEEFYYLGDHMLKFFVKCQGYDDLYKLVAQGELSRIRFAHEIWRSMPQAWYTDFISELIRSHF